MIDSLPRLFFVDGKLHKKIRVVKTDNVAICFSFPDEKQIRYMFTLLLRDYRKAYTISEVAKIVQRPLREVHAMMKNKVIDRPSGYEYNITNKRPKNLHWSQDEIVLLRDRLYELTPKGKDGFPLRKFRLASKAEVLEAINGDVSYYIRDAEGTYRKVWRAV